MMSLINGGVKVTVLMRVCKLLPLINEGVKVTVPH